MSASRLVITSDSTELARVRTWLKGELSGRGVSAQAQSELQLAVGELTANAIKHSYQGLTGQPIHITVDSRDNGVVIFVEDFGQPFDPARYQDPDLDEVNEGGLGLYLARRVADELSFDLSRDRGTKWTLVKYRTHGMQRRSREGEPWTSR